MKKWLLALLSISVLAGCTVSTSDAEVSETATTEEVTETTEEMNFSEEYTGVEEENAFVYADQTAILNMLEHGSGIVLFGFPECPFCQAYVPMLNEAAMEQGATVLYYNILDDRTENTEFYQQVVAILGDNLDYDSDGNPRIYVPEAVFVVKGEIIGYDNESSLLSSDDISPEDYWTEEKVTALMDKFGSLIEQVMAAREETDSQGCDTSCDYSAG